MKMMMMMCVCVCVCVVYNLLLMHCLTKPPPAQRLETHPHPRGAHIAVTSKFTHTCGQPNAVFKACGGMGYHVALKDIGEGDLLTTTYLEGGPMLMATDYRCVGGFQGLPYCVLVRVCVCMSAHADVPLRCL